MFSISKMSLRLPAGLSDLGDDALTQRLLSEEEVGGGEKLSDQRGKLGTLTGVFIPTSCPW